MSFDPRRGQRRGRCRRATGATVITTANAAAHDLIRRLGADHALDYVTEDFSEIVASITDNKGVDLILDFIGAPYFERNVNVLNFGGHLVQIGIMGGVKTRRTRSSLFVTNPFRYLT